MSKTIKSLLDTTNNYIAEVDQSGILDPFNYYSIITEYWVKESKDRHREFVNDVLEVFGTTAYIQVGMQLNAYLHTDALAASVRLIELDAPSTIIENAVDHAAKLSTNECNAHLLVVMLITSLNICK